MSALQMLDMCVNYIARRHHMLTDRHVEILDQVWELYEPAEMPPLPPSPPPERQHLRFDEVERPDKEERPKWPSRGNLGDDIWERDEEDYVDEEEEEDEAGKWEREEEACKWQEYYEHLQQEQARKWQENEKERQRKLDAMWHQVPQEKPVSASMQQEAYGDNDCCSDCDDHCNEFPTCDADRCTYECAEACGSAAPAQLLQQVSNTTCNNDCGQYGCLPRQIPASVVEAAVESDDEMPALIPFADYARSRGLMNPEETEEVEETEIVDSQPPQPPQPPQQPEPRPPKAQPLFPYNHHLWPSPRAKAVVRHMLGSRAKEVLGVSVLTHDNCMSWLAKAHQLTNEQLLSTTVYELHNRERVAWSEKSVKPYWQLPHVCPCVFCKNSRYHSRY